MSRCKVYTGEQFNMASKQDWKLIVAGSCDLFCAYLENLKGHGHLACFGLYCFESKVENVNNVGRESLSFLAWHLVSFI